MVAQAWLALHSNTWHVTLDLENDYWHVTIHHQFYKSKVSNSSGATNCSTVHCAALQPKHSTVDFNETNKSCG